MGEGMFGHLFLCSGVRAGRRARPPGRFGQREALDEVRNYNAGGVWKVGSFYYWKFVKSHTAFEVALAANYIGFQRFIETMDLEIRN
ncbi:hypothetical protein [Arenibaculum pallidiluteum]|uniref:hypothetical protein n=1 Tax=Arenibaculum pallidiluteum TaxID=2812559 RepID=UPI001A9601BE|nr:hypothetical protein [Arenibaculum pallidiluteum]